MGKKKKPSHSTSGVGALVQPVGSSTGCSAGDAASVPLANVLRNCLPASPVPHGLGGNVVDNLPKSPSISCSLGTEDTVSDESVGKNKEGSKDNQGTTSKVDASKELVRVVKIKFPNGNVREQEIIYEQEPKFCNNCKVFGHSSVGCIHSREAIGETKANPNTSNVENTFNVAKAQDNQDAAQTNVERAETIETENAPLKLISTDGNLNTAGLKSDCNTDVETAVVNDNAGGTEQTEKEPLQHQDTSQTDGTEGNFTEVTKKRKVPNKRSNVKVTGDGLTFIRPAIKVHANNKGKATKGEQRMTSNKNTKKMGTAPPSSS
ncbi:unnamed protein product [Fraxinus pennsylvanica]|uniref:Uncharacterized protein n=1 Tax=Fraxinus pennsylvanica TaxID=56036 RepID=A0AAD1Z0E4_9LAMI|nr:unnamed protein product [Fraxinus pennsylvanica]